MNTFVPGTVKPEELYERMRVLGAKLGLPSPQMLYAIDVTAPDGATLTRLDGRSRTYTRNFWNLFFGQLTQAKSGTTTFGAGYLACKSTSGSVASNAFTGAAAFHPAFANTETQGQAGVQLGSGTTAESFEGYTLATPITSGSSAGQLVYNNHTNVQNYDAATKTWAVTYSRVLTNTSAGSVSVNEIGMYTTNSFGTYMMVRDLLPATLVVPAGGTITVGYTYTLTFPA